MTDSNDVVDVLVTEPHPVREDVLRIEVSRNGEFPKALCTGPPGSNVHLSVFTANHLEGFALTKCLADIGIPCGSSFHYRLDGYDISRYSALTGLPPKAGSLVCASDVGDVAYVFYFTGLDGEICTWSPTGFSLSPLVNCSCSFQTLNLGEKFQSRLNLDFVSSGSMKKQKQMQMSRHLKVVRPPASCVTCVVTSISLVLCT